MVTYNGKSELQTYSTCQNHHFYDHPILPTSPKESTAIILMTARGKTTNNVIFLVRTVSENNGLRGGHVAPSRHVAVFVYCQLIFLYLDILLSIS